MWSARANGEKRGRERFIPVNINCVVCWGNWRRFCLFILSQLKNLRPKKQSAHIWNHRCSALPDLVPCNVWKSHHLFPNIPQEVTVACGIRAVAKMCRTSNINPALLVMQCAIGKRRSLPALSRRSWERDDIQVGAWQMTEVGLSGDFERRDAMWTRSGKMAWTPEEVPSFRCYCVTVKGGNKSSLIGCWGSGWALGLRATLRLSGWTQNQLSGSALVFWWSVLTEGQNS